jgi:hypothetical protein
MLKMHFHSTIGPGIGLMPCFDELQLIFAVLLNADQNLLSDYEFQRVRL